MTYYKPDASLLDFAAPILAFANLLLVTISITLFYRRLKKDHDWNRRHATQQLLYELTTGKFAEIRRRLEVEHGVDVARDDQTFSTILPTVDEAKKSDFFNAVKAVLNLFETISIGMRNHVLEEDICYEHCSAVFVMYRRWAKAYIDEARVKHPSIWVEFDHYSKQWEQKLAAEIASMVPKRKKPTS